MDSSRNQAENSPRSNDFSSKLALSSEKIFTDKVVTPLGGLEK